jgi:hypothetical protein
MASVSLPKNIAAKRGQFVLWKILGNRADGNRVPNQKTRRDVRQRSVKLRLREVLLLVARVSVLELSRPNRFQRRGVGMEYYEVS